MKIPDGRCLTTVLYGLCIIMHSCVHASRRGDSLIVNTRQGRVRGARYRKAHLGDNVAVDVFLGIPYAKAPVNRLRFKHPQPIDPWTGTFNATIPPNSCYQSPDEFFGDFKGSTMWNPTTLVSEDCLYINVWSPRRNGHRPKKSAVMIWIYGGSFYSGTTTLNVYDGLTLAGRNDIIVVSIGYRLGALGFFTLGHPNAPGNAGLFDQLMGMEWVQENIRAFGGDPDNVTLFGESAGSVSVSLHLLSPLSANNFARAIMQSGTANMQWGTISMKEGIERSTFLATEALGCKNSEDVEMIIECMKGIPPHRLVEEQWVVRGIMQFPFLPVIDGSFLVEAPAISIQRRNFKKCPILLGSNLNEASFFLAYEIPEYLKLNETSMTREQFVNSISKLFFWYPQYPTEINSFGRDAILYQYSNWIDPNDKYANIAALDSAVADCHFVCSVNEFAMAYSETNEAVYSYYFTERFSANPWPLWAGVLHGDEILFVFGQPFKPELGYTYTETERDFSSEIMTYWTNFAKTG